MSLNSTPTSERIHIGIFGKRNAGKSSIINAITEQNVAIVSEIKGTTTDPVFKSMELLPLGPVTFIDTAGIDDDSNLGDLRVKRSLRMLNKTDIALLICDSTQEITKDETLLIDKFKEKNIPYLIIMNKCDLLKYIPNNTPKKIYVSASTHKGINELKEKISNLLSADNKNKYLISDLLNPNDIVVLVIPIDSSAPKGRLILPQQQTIRNILESNATTIITKDTQFKETLKILNKKPKIIVTDSQVFKYVSRETPKDILLTSFSILFARYKGNLETLVNGAIAIENLNNGDTVLISEGCTHHRQCEDIGTVKIPNWLKEYTNKNIIFETSSGNEFPENLSKYKLIIHCGGCTLNEKEMKYRIKCAEDAKVPIVNYGILISYINGILERSIQCFPDIIKKI